MNISTSNPTATAKSDKLAEILARFREKKRIESLASAESVSFECDPLDPLDPATTTATTTITDKYGKLITLNTLQQSFVTLAGSQGKSAVLIGAAGTGKTTAQKSVCIELIQSGHVGLLESGGHKHLISGSPGIVICAYTRRAVANIRRNLPVDLQSNAITIHKLLEYAPVYDSVIDPETGQEKTKMSFQPARHSGNPLPSSIRTIIFEESSMLGLDLYKQVISACPHNPQLIFLGDIQQLPPVFGPAILGFKLLELPVIELTEVYRQALESPIISLAHRVLSGVPMPAKEFPEWKKSGQLTIHPWKKKISPEVACSTAGLFFTDAFDKGVYNPEEDIILIPFNKSFGTIELNNLIANHLAHKRGETVHQIIAGFNKYHLSCGDKILYDKEDAVVIDISYNPAYSGASPAAASKTLDYWGFDSASSSPHAHELEKSDEDVDFILSQVASIETQGEDRVRQASHIITLRMLDSDAEIKLDKASELNSLLLGYCLTVHKAQGSEYSKVFFLLHQSHATMISRELLYTGITRAREELYIICEPETLVKGILSQRVKGDTVEEKSEYFKGKVDSGYLLE